MLPERSYLCSLSSRTMVYKGLLTPWQFPRFFEDLCRPEFAVNFAIFHQRYSTNTEPSWQLAQPFRYVAHNGEINTVVGNRRWLRAREREIRKRIGVGKWFHLLEENVSDSAVSITRWKSSCSKAKPLRPPCLRWCRRRFCTIPFSLATCAAHWKRCRMKPNRGTARRRWCLATAYPWAQNWIATGCDRCATP